MTELEIKNTQIAKFILLYYLLIKNILRITIKTLFNNFI